MTLAPKLATHVRGVGLVGLPASAVAGVLCTVGYFNWPEQFFPAYLTAFIYWLGLSLGSMAVAMVHGMTGGGWGRAVRRIVEAGYQTLPLMALLFAPLWLNVARIYIWADPAAIQHSTVLARKAGFLNVAGFQSRAVAYFTIWIIITWVLNACSPNDDCRSDSPRVRRLAGTGGLGFILYAFTITLASVDWIMSLEPEWYSTMFGLIQIAGQMIAGLSLAIVVLALLGRFEPWTRTATPTRLNDLGNLLLAAVMFWTYTSFFQYLVIWMGNLPEENAWYVRRSQAGWQYLAFGLAALHFAVPFTLLLMRRLKRHTISLSRIAALLLVMHYVDLYWIIVPGFERAGTSRLGFTFHWLSVAAFLAIGGLWLSVFAWRLSVRVQLPLYDPKNTEKADERSAATAAA